MYNRLHTIPACDRTDRQTSCHGIVRAMHTRRAVKIENMFTRFDTIHDSDGRTRTLHDSKDSVRQKNAVQKYSQSFCRAMLCICAVARCVRLSVCPSRSWSLLKRINISSKFFHHRVQSMWAERERSGSKIYLSGRERSGVVSGSPRIQWSVHERSGGPLSGNRAESGLKRALKCRSSQTYRIA